MSKAIIVPMLLLRNPRLWEQHQALLLTSSESRMTLGAIEAVTGVDLGGSDRSELDGRLAVLLTYLLKWEFQADRRSEKWRAMIHMQRVRIAILIMRRPSLARYAGRVLRDRYRVAREAAMIDTGLSHTSFPEDCPYSAIQALDGDYLPAAG
jgi:hypothetical protein